MYGVAVLTQIRRATVLTVTPLSWLPSTAHARGAAMGYRALTLPVLDNMIASFS